MTDPLPEVLPPRHAWVVWSETRRYWPGDPRRETEKLCYAIAAHPNGVDNIRIDLAIGERLPENLEVVRTRMAVVPVFKRG